MLAVRIVGALIRMCASIFWEENLNERFSGSGCPVGMSAGVVLTILIDWDKCEQHHSLDLGPRMYKSREG